MKDLYVVLVTGSRDWTDTIALEDDLRVANNTAHAQGKLLLVVHGACRGADLLAESICNGLGIHTAAIAALWQTNHRAAGPIRNEVMAALLEYDEVLAYPLPRSVGTKHMMKIARTKS